MMIYLDIPTKNGAFPDFPVRYVQKPDGRIFATWT